MVAIWIVGLPPKKLWKNWRSMDLKCPITFPWGWFKSSWFSRSKKNGTLERLERLCSSCFPTLPQWKQLFLNIVIQLFRSESNVADARNPIDVSVSEERCQPTVDGRNVGPTYCTAAFSCRKRWLSNGFMAANITLPLDPKAMKHEGFRPSIYGS